MKKRHLLTSCIFGLYAFTTLYATEEKDKPKENITYVKGELTSSYSSKFKDKQSVSVEVGHKVPSSYSTLQLGVSAGFDLKRNFSIPKKALLGVHLIDREEDKLTLELCRRAFQEVFNSKVQFAAPCVFKGLHGTYTRETSEGNITFKQGAFFEKKGKPSYISELNVENLSQTGAYTTFSFTYWDRMHQIFQTILGYKDTLYKYPINLYIGGVNNFNKEKDSTKDGKKIGGYLGATVGELKKKGDVSLDVNYRYLTAHSIFNAANAIKHHVYTTLKYNLKDNLSFIGEYSWQGDKGNKYSVSLKHVF